MTPRRVAIDTNVLVSALISDGPPSQIVQRALMEQIELIVPDAVLTELERVLVSKLDFAPMRARELVETVSAIASERTPTPHDVPAVTGHPPDDRILAAAVSAGAELLVTGDRRHLLPVGEHEGIQIVTPQALLAELVD
ncbi:MAG: putative toxin-antitoxin system toxin component, PIN family [Solirubrobacteraceae bacterium]